MNAQTLRTYENAGAFDSALAETRFEFQNILLINERRFDAQVK